MNFKRLNKFYFAPTVLGSALMAPIAAYALPPCANNTGMGGEVGLNVKVNISPSDITNNSAQAWREIAEAAQAKYGANVAQDYGMVQVTVVATVWGVTSPVGNFPITFNGGASIGQSILMERGLANTYQGAMEDMACDPKKNDGNDCCEECSQGYCQLGPMDLYNMGHIKTNMKAIVRKNGLDVVSSRKKIIA